MTDCELSTKDAYIFINLVRDVFARAAHSLAVLLFLLGDRRL